MTLQADPLRKALPPDGPDLGHGDRQLGHRGIRVLLVLHRHPQPPERSLHLHHLHLQEVGSGEPQAEAQGRVFQRVQQNGKFQKHVRRPQRQHNGERQQTEVQYQQQEKQLRKPSLLKTA